MGVFSTWLGRKIGNVGGRKGLLAKLNVLAQKTERKPPSAPTIDSLLTGRRQPSETTAKDIAIALAAPAEGYENYHRSNWLALAEAEVAQVMIAVREERENASVNQYNPPKRELPIFVARREKLWNDVLKGLTGTDDKPPVRAVCLHGLPGLGKSKFAEEVGLYFSTGITPRLNRRLVVVSFRNIKVSKQEAQNGNASKRIMRRIAHQLGAPEVTPDEDYAHYLLGFMGQGGDPVILVFRDIPKNLDKPVEAVANNLLRQSEDGSLVIVIASNIKLELEKGLTQLVTPLSVDEAAVIVADPAMYPIASAKDQEASAVDLVHLRALLDKIHWRTPTTMGLVAGLLREKNMNVNAVESHLDLSALGKAGSQGPLFEQMFKSLAEDEDRELLIDLSGFVWSFKPTMAAAALQYLHVPFQPHLQIHRITEQLHKFVRLGWLDLAYTNQEGVEGTEEPSVRFSMVDYLRDWLRGKLSSEREAQILAGISAAVLKQIQEYQETHSNDPFEQDWLRPLIPELHDIQNVFDADVCWIQEKISSNQNLGWTPDETARLSRFISLLDYLPLLWECGGWCNRGAASLKIAGNILQDIKRKSIPVQSDKPIQHHWIKVLRQRAVLLYRTDDYSEARKTITLALNKAKAEKNPALEGSCRMVLGVLELIHGTPEIAIRTLREAREQLDKSSDKEAIYFSWWASLWEGRCEFCEAKFDRAAALFRRCFAKVKSGQQSRAETIALLWLARTYIFQAEYLRYTDVSSSVKPDAKNIHIQYAKRCLIAAERSINRMPFLSLGAHFKILESLYHRVRSVEDPQRLEFANALFNDGLTTFTRLLDRYWLAMILSIASLQSLKLPTASEIRADQKSADTVSSIDEERSMAEATAIDQLLKAVEQWAFLASQSRPLIPPKVALDFMAATVDVLSALDSSQLSAMQRIDVAGRARDLYLRPGENSFKYGEFLAQWRKEKERQEAEKTAREMGEGSDQDPISPTSECCADSSA